MYFKFLEPSDLDKYPHLNSKMGNLLLSDDQFFFYNDLNKLIEKHWINTLISPEELASMYNKIYDILHDKIRSRIRLVKIDSNAITNTNSIKLGLTQTGRDPNSFNLEEKLILNICGHLGLFDIYNLKNEIGKITRDNLTEDKKKVILDKYVHNQEVLKVLKDDGFQEVGDWATKELLYNKFELNQ